MRGSALILLAGLLPCGRLHAQLETITPGSRLRVTLQDPKQKRIEGELVARISDAVPMQGATALRFGRHGPTLPRSIPLSTVRRVDVSVGRSPLTGALRGGALGLTVAGGYGGMVWLFSKINGNGGYFKQNTQVDVSGQAMGAMIGLVPICALIGGLNAPDKWRRVFPTR